MKSWIAAIRGSPFLGVMMFDLEPISVMASALASSVWGRWRFISSPSKSALNGPQQHSLNRNVRWGITWKKKRNMHAFGCFSVLLFSLYTSFETLIFFIVCPQNKSGDIEINYLCLSAVDVRLEHGIVQQQIYFFSSTYIITSMLLRAGFLFQSSCYQTNGINMCQWGYRFLHAQDILHISRKYFGLHNHYEQVVIKKIFQKFTYSNKQVNNFKHCSIIISNLA